MFIVHNTLSIIYRNRKVNTEGIDNFGTLACMEGWQARLRAHMKATGVRQGDIAKALGMTQGGVGHWFTKRNEIKLTDFIRLCRAAGANPQMILFGTTPAGAELLTEIKKLVTSTPVESYADPRRGIKIKPFRGKERRKSPFSDRRNNPVNH